MAIWQILLLGAIFYGAIWAYFEASRLRDSFQIGVGPAGLAPQAWTSLIVLFAPIAFPLFLQARDRATLQEPRQGPPPVVVTGGVGLWGWLGTLVGVGAAVALVALGLTPWAPLAGLFAAVALFGGRRSRLTSVAFSVEAPAAFEQVGFRPLKPQEENADDDPDYVLDLDRVASERRPPGRVPPDSMPNLVLPPLAAPPQLSKGTVPAPPPMRPVSSVPIQIAPGAEILWAAAEEGEVDTRDPRATVALANPEVFRQLGGIFAPPTANTQEADWRKGVAPPQADPLSLAKPPAIPPIPGPAPSMPPPPPSARPASPPAPPPLPHRADVPRRVESRVPGSPLPGGFVARPKVEKSSPRTGILVAVAILVVVGVGVAVYFREQLFPQSAEPSLEIPDPGQMTENVEVTPAPVEEEDGEGPSSEVENDEGESADLRAAMTTWMPIYLEWMGPIGLSLERIDYEGFNADSCDELERNVGAAQEGLVKAPDETVDVNLRICFDFIRLTTEECRRARADDWSAALLTAKRCTHDLQMLMSERYEFSGLLELELESESGLARSKASMSGRYLAANSAN